jgi:hypothetical protein
MLVHCFLNNGQVVNGEFQPVDINQFTTGVQHTKSFGDIWIDTVLKVGADWPAQKMFTSITPTTANGSTTWTWTLPDHFPPGQYLRVKVTGGTLHPGPRQRAVRHARLVRDHARARLADAFALIALVARPDGIRAVVRRHPPQLGRVPFSLVPTAVHVGAPSA